MNNVKRPYVIWFPCGARSNGIRVMLNLGQSLQERGYEVYHYVENMTNWDEQKYPVIRDISQDLRDRAIVIYPEIIAGNPLRIRNVVRYILYYPGRQGRPYAYYKHDFLVTYLPEFYPGVPVLTVPWIDSKLFYDGHCVRECDCCFVYKGGEWRHVPELDGMRRITMSDPPTREEFADLLRHTRILYSFDSCTAVLEEALCCGVTVRVVTPTGFEEFHGHHDEYVRNYGTQLQAFIEKTQGLDYRYKAYARLLPSFWWLHFRNVIGFYSFWGRFWLNRKLNRLLKFCGISQNYV